MAEPELLTADEVGARLRLPRSTVYHLAKTGEIPAVRFGRSWRFPARGIERLREGSGFPWVLVVDDDVVTRMLVSSALEPSGYRVREAGGVDEALEACRRQAFDLLFVDLRMPGRAGSELIRELLGDYRLNQIVVITAHPDLAEAGELLELGAITLLRKPLSVHQLMECAERMLQAGRSRPSSGGRPAGSAVAHPAAGGRLEPVPAREELRHEKV